MPSPPALSAMALITREINTSVIEIQAVGQANRFIFASFIICHLRIPTNIVSSSSLYTAAHDSQLELCTRRFCRESLNCLQRPFQRSCSLTFHSTTLRMKEFAPISHLPICIVSGLLERSESTIVDPECAGGQVAKFPDTADWYPGLPPGHQV